MDLRSVKLKTPADFIAPVPSDGVKRLKYSAILDDLLAGIRRNQFKDADQIPSERALAAKYGVTRTTARRALMHLAEMGLVERRGALGTLIRTGRTGDNSVTVSLVCAAIPRADIEEFLHWATVHARRRGWSTRVVRMEQHDEPHVLRALSIGNPCVILGQPVDFRPNSPLQRALQRAASRCAMIAGRMDFLGVTSVVGDDAAGITLASELLREHGHRRVALVCGATPLDHPTMRLQYDTWRKWFGDSMDDAAAAENIIPVRTPMFDSVALSAYTAVGAFLSGTASRQTTGMICLGRELADGAVAACRDADRPVPQKMSLVQYGSTRDWPLYAPPRDCVDVHMDQHVEVALQSLEDAMAEKPVPAKRKAQQEQQHLHLIQPTLHRRGSVKRID